MPTQYVIGGRAGDGGGGADRQGTARGGEEGRYCFIRGNPCRLEVCEVLPKATANGNKRLHLKGPHVFTGKSYEDTLNLTAGFHGIDVPVTVKAQYSLLDADPDTGFLSLLTDSGDCKEDVGLARGEDGAFDDLGKG